MDHTRICRKCETEKEIGEYYTFMMKGRKYTRWECKPCYSEYNSKRVLSPETIENNRIRSKEYYIENKDKIRDWGRKYNSRDDVKEKRRVLSKKYRAENKDKLNKACSEWAKNNREHLREYAKKYYAENKERVREYQRKYLERRKEKDLTNSDT